MAVMDARQAAAAIAAAMRARDHAALVALYADDVVLHSPVTAADFCGKGEVGALMAHVMDGFETWEQTFVLGDGTECVFGAEGHIGGRNVQLAEHIQMDEDGRVADICIYGRPLASIAAIAAVAAPPLAARHGRARAVFVGLLSRGLPGVLAGGDKLVTRLAR